MKASHTYSLCQNKNNSCGACCGIFQINIKINIKNISALYDILKKRTDTLSQLFSKIQTQNKDSWNQLLKWKQTMEKTEQNDLKTKKHIQDIYLCPFLGILQQKPIRLGCLIHPEVLKKQKFPIALDYRDLSFYGKSICQTYDCPSKEKLTWEKQIFLDSIFADPLQYSAAIADYMSLQALFSLAPKVFTQWDIHGPSYKQKKQYAKWFSLGFTWPWRRPDRGFVLCSFEKYYADNSLMRHLPEQWTQADLQYHIQQIINQNDLWQTRYIDFIELTDLLEALHSQFASKQELTQAIAFLQTYLRT